MPLNTVLLNKGIGFFREELSDGRHYFFRDGSGLEYQICELISIGVGKIAVESGSLEKQFVEGLNPSLQKRIVWVDRVNARNTFLAIMSPIAEELSLDIEDAPFAYKGMENASDGVKNAVLNSFGLYYWILALQNHLQLDLDINSICQSLEFLLTELKGSQSRTNLSILLGILRTYKRFAVDAISLNAFAPPDQVRLL
ncbi:MAG: hypothetical protein KDA84_23110, partial [Planctomycetaceae bacterium]|nr:hypothetical protein [Planctomycetaceae bacterium]